MSTHVSVAPAPFDLVTVANRWCRSHLTRLADWKTQSVQQSPSRAQSPQSLYTLRSSVGGTAWVSAVGDDPFGRRIIASLGSAGVDVSHAITVPSLQTGIYFIDPLPDGHTSVHYYRADSAASLMTTEILAPAAFAALRGSASHRVYSCPVTRMRTTGLRSALQSPSRTWTSRPLT